MCDIDKQEIPIIDLASRKPKVHKKIKLHTLDPFELKVNTWIQDFFIKKIQADLNKNSSKLQYIKTKYIIFHQKLT